MKIVSTTEARKNIAALVDHVKDTGEVYGIGRRNSIDAIMVAFPKVYNKGVNDITNINAYSKSFDFLEHEPDLYSFTDVKNND